MAVFIIIIIIASGVFLGFMIPTLMLSSFHRTTVKLVEAFRFCPKGTLVVDEQSYLTGAGYQRRGKTYRLRLSGSCERDATGKTFGSLLLIFQGAFLALSLLLIAVLKVAHRL
jgi:hypothetical protein